LAEFWQEKNTKKIPSMICQNFVTWKNILIILMLIIVDNCYSPLGPGSNKPPERIQISKSDKKKIQKKL